LAAPLLISAETAFCFDLKAYGPICSSCLHSYSATCSSAVRVTGEQGWSDTLTAGICQAVNEPKLLLSTSGGHLPKQKATQPGVGNGGAKPAVALTP